MGIESPVHLAFIAIVALIVLGPKRLPEVARALGQGIREFRGAMEAAANPTEPFGEPPPAPPPALPALPAPAVAQQSPDVSAIGGSPDVSGVAQQSPDVSPVVGPLRPWRRG